MAGVLKALTVKETGSSNALLDPDDASAQTFKGTKNSEFAVLGLLKDDVVTSRVHKMAQQILPSSRAIAVPSGWTKDHISCTGLR